MRDTVGADVVVCEVGVHLDLIDRRGDRARPGQLLQVVDLEDIVFLVFMIHMQKLIYFFHLV
jgi:hypothetical protein